MSLPEPLARLVSELRRLPGIGEKSAERIAFHLLAADPDDVRGFGRTLAELHERVRQCANCGNFADAETCGFCRDPERSDRAICVVGSAADIAVVERARAFGGRYFVLGPNAAPIPGDERLLPLLRRIRAGGVEEVVVATNPTHEGEGTAAWLAQTLRPEGVRITRIGIGVPIGSELVHADMSTMSEAFAHRSPL